MKKILSLIACFPMLVFGQDTNSDLANNKRVNNNTGYIYSFNAPNNENQTNINCIGNDDIWNRTNAFLANFSVDKEANGNGYLKISMAEQSFDVDPNYAYPMGSHRFTSGDCQIMNDIGQTVDLTNHMVLKARVKATRDVQIAMFALSGSRGHDASLSYETINANDDWQIVQFTVSEKSWDNRGDITLIDGWGMLMKLSYNFSESDLLIDWIKIGVPDCSTNDGKDTTVVNIFQDPQLDGTTVLNETTQHLSVDGCDSTHYQYTKYEKICNGVETADTTEIPTVGSTILDNQYAVINTYNGTNWEGCDSIHRKLVHYVPSECSNDTVYITDTIYNGACDTLTIDLSGLNNTQDLLADFEISIFPNPANNSLTLDFTKPQAYINTVHVSIINSLGSKMESKELTTVGQSIFDVSDYPAGVYYITINDWTNQLVSSKPFIVKK